MHHHQFRIAGAPLRTVHWQHIRDVSDVDIKLASLFRFLSALEGLDGTPRALPHPILEGWPIVGGRVGYPAAGNVPDIRGQGAVMMMNPFLDFPRSTQIIPLVRPRLPLRQRNSWIPRALFFAIVGASAVGLILLELPILMDAYTIQN